MIHLDIVHAILLFLAKPVGVLHQLKCLHVDPWPGNQQLRFRLNIPTQAPEGDKAGATMMSEEEQDEGQVSFKVYWAYFKSGSGLLSVLILIVLSAAEAMNQYQSVSPKAGTYACCPVTLEMNRAAFCYGTQQVLPWLAESMCQQMVSMQRS